ncbi:CSD domain-containing protein [Durusdinium trenchii]|uniref:CSD domain-containing protein n=1 Tax=Durusdinium trenchii TaxID=1381693 RepID=A0ABP0MZ54_9DINO
MVTIPPLPHGAWPDLAPEFVAPERHRGDLGAQRPRARRSSGASKKAASKKPTKVPPEAFTALFHARCCLFGLLSVELLRLLIVRAFPKPGGLEWTAQMLCCAANCIVMLGSLPVFAHEGLGICVNRRCLGSLLTLILTSSTCTWGAAVLALFPGGGFQRVMNNQLLDEGAPQALRFMGVWNCLMLSSVSLQTALLVSAWTFYRTYRALGLYPPEPRKGHVHPDVSPFEFVCEAEDVALLSDQCHGNWSCERGPGGLAAQEATVTPGPPPRRVLHEDDVHYSLEEVRPSK